MPRLGGQAKSAKLRPETPSNSIRSNMASRLSVGAIISNFAVTCSAKLSGKPNILGPPGSLNGTWLSSVKPNLFTKKSLASAIFFTTNAERYTFEMHPLRPVGLGRGGSTRFTRAKAISSWPFMTTSLIVNGPICCKIGSEWPWKPFSRSKS